MEKPFATQKSGYLKYVRGAALLVAILLGASLLDMRYSTSLCSVFAKLLLLLALILYAAKKKLTLWNACARRYYLLALVPFLFALPMYVGRPDASVDVGTAVLGFAGVFTTGIVEELYYRAVGLYFFRGKPVTYRLIVILSLVFSLSHTVNYFFADPLSVTLQLAVAFALGMFSTGVFLRTRNISIPICAHVLLNGTSMFFALFSHTGGAIGSIGYLIVCSLLIAAMTAAGFLLTKPVLQQAI